MKKLILIILLFLSGLSEAAVNTTFEFTHIFEGRLDLVGSRNCSFKIYDDSTGNGIVWWEVTPTTFYEVGSDAVIYHELGSVIPLDNLRLNGSYFVNVFCGPPIVSTALEQFSIGIQGPPGDACWDLNGDGVCSLPVEDTNFDGVCTVSDCKGPMGEQGLQGISGLQGIQGEQGIPGPAASFPLRDSNNNVIADVIDGALVITGTLVIQ